MLSPKPDIPETDNVPAGHKTTIKAVSVASATLPILLVAALVVAYLGGKFNSVDSLQDYIARWGALGPLVLTVFQGTQVVIPVVPPMLGCAAGAILFGPAVGFWCNYIGISAGSIAAFLLSRRFGAPLMLELFPNGNYGKWAEWAENSKHYSALLFAAMVLPLCPDNLLCYLTGLSNMSLRRFTWIIVLGKPWVILAYSVGFSLIG